jgi:hypothetical protein
MNTELRGLGGFILEISWISKFQIFVIFEIKMKKINKKTIILLM